MKTKRTTVLTPMQSEGMVKSYVLKSNIVKYS